MDSHSSIPDREPVDLLVDVRHGSDPVLSALQIANVTSAVAYGIVIGDAALRQVLYGGAGPLVDRQTENR